jgi:hypothetical protein
VEVVWWRGVGRACPAAPDRIWRRWAHQTTPTWTIISQDLYVLGYMCVYVCNKPHQPRPKRAIQPAAFNGPQPSRARSTGPQRVKNTICLYIVMHLWHAIDKIAPIRAVI